MQACEMKTQRHLMTTTATAGVLVPKEIQTAEFIRDWYNIQQNFGLNKIKLIMN